MEIYTNQREIEKIAELISSIIPNGCGVTLGGSRAHSMNDQISDVEMYFYSTSGIPKLEDIERCLNSIGAKHKRSSKFLWNQYPWGPHSFFEVYGLSFEIGYRVVGDIQTKIESYLAGGVAPTQDCHDLGLGYMYSGLAASVCSEQIILTFDEEIERLKMIAVQFPDELLEALKDEYLKNAESLLEGKLLTAALREDSLLYEVMSSRIIRNLMVMAFAISETHFPGDKWNEPLLLRTTWKNAEVFLMILKKHLDMDYSTPGILLKKREVLLEAYKLIKGDLF